MIKKIMLATTIAATLMLSGCGSADATGASRLAAQNAIDTGSPEQAIRLLEATPIADMNATQAKAFLATLSNSTKKTLASAYMSKAGLNLIDIVSKMSSASNTNSTNSFATLATSLVGDANKTVGNVKNIDSAIQYYESIAKATTSASPARSISLATMTNLSKDIKLYLGMAYLSKTIMLLDMLGNVATLKGGTLDNNFKASAKAIDCFYSNNCTGVISDQNITIADQNLTLGIYKVDVNSTNYYRAALDINGSKKLIITNYRNVSSASDLNSTGVLSFGAKYTLEQLVGAINDAFNALTSAIPKDLKGDIDKYKAKIGTDSNGNITVEQIKAYIISN